jgi:hypothetical protein
MLGNALGDMPAHMWIHTKTLVFFTYHQYVCVCVRREKRQVFKDNCPDIRLNINGSSRTLH